MMPKTVQLTPLRDEDTAILFRWINDRDEVLHNAAYQPVHEASHVEWFTRIRQRKDLVIFGIRTADDALIGSCQLHSIDPIHRSAELQIRIGEKSARGRGYGSAATRQLVEIGFRDLNLHRIYLHVFASNEAALRTYDSVGFTREGLLRQAAHIDGAYVDVVVMSILRDDRR